MNFKDLTRAMRDGRLALLKRKHKDGMPLSQEEQDFLHMETNEENVQYWKSENEKSCSDERHHYCQAVARNIICALRALEPVTDDEHPLAYVLCNALEEADNLPAMH